MSDDLWNMVFCIFLERNQKMKESMRWFLDRSYLAGYAVLLAVTITVAMAIGGTTALAQAGEAVPRKSIRGIMLAQAAPSIFRIQPDFYIEKF